MPGTTNILLFFSLSFCILLTAATKALTIVSFTNLMKYDQPNCVAKVISIRNEKKVTNSFLFLFCPGNISIFSPRKLHICLIFPQKSEYAY